MDFINCAFFCKNWYYIGITRLIDSCCLKFIIEDTYCADWMLPDVNCLGIFRPLLGWGQSVVLRNGAET